MYRVIVLDTLAPEGLALLEAAHEVEHEIRIGLKGEELRTALLEFDGAICRSGVKLTAEVLDGNHRLKAIVRAGVGTDNIDKNAATRLGIVVMNTPDGNTVSTAEHTVAMMLALSRNIAPAYQSLIEGRWDRGKYMGTQLAGKTLGVIGLGRIGQAVALRAKAFEMRVLAFDPFLAPERARQLGVEPIASVKEMLPEIDYLTVHTHLTEETRNLIGLPELDILKPGARLINCARGGLYNEDALVEGLKLGKLAGVALDVYNEEPCKTSPLFGLPGVLCTPHLGASTEEAQTQVAVEGVGLLIDYLTTGAIRHSVNMAPLDAKTLEDLRGYLNLAYRLGVLMSGLQQGVGHACRLCYRGEIAEKNTNLLTSAFAAGLLSSSLGDEVNIVNAEMLLRERGFEITAESRADRGAFNASITAEVETEAATYRVGGTLFGHDMVRLIQLQDYRLEAYLDGYLIVFHHKDVPGIIGKFGTIFGNHQVNIAQMSVGRAGSAPGGGAVGVLNVDSEPSPAALAEVLAHPSIESVRVIKLPTAGQLPTWLQG
jgi:D-3-phosphoglycerate dehydrogenase